MRPVHWWIVHCNAIVLSTNSNPYKTQALTNLAVLDDSPFEALHVNADGEQGREQDDSFQTESLAFVVLGFGSPVQERDDVLGHL